METTDYKRLIKYRLHPADVLFFRCMPGNAGEWLLPLVEAHFPIDLIFPPYAADSEATFSGYTDEARSRFRLVRGNFEFGTGDRAIFRYLARNPIKMTWLRHPIGRALDLHQDALTHGRIAPNITLREYVQSREGRLDLCNAQARAIVGQTVRAMADHNTLGYSLEAFQKLAEDNLEQHHFVGLAEEVERSSQLLNYVFDWEPAGPARSPAALAEIDSEARTAILNQAEYDLPFYEFARSLFEGRYRQMVDELLEFESRWRAAGIGLPEKTRTSGFLARIAHAVRRRMPGYKTRSGGLKRRRRLKGSGKS